MDEMTAALERAELYFMAHPGTPCAVRRPRLSKRGGTWTAWVGRSPEDGIAGSGWSVEAALREFDAQYIAALRSDAGDGSPALRAPIQASFRRAA